MSGEEQKHRIRVSVDIQSIRNNNFQGSIYVKYYDVPSMGITKFKTPIGLQLFKKHIEEQFITEGFCSYEFDAAKDDLLRILREEKLSMEIWHNDRLQKDQLIGKTIVPFGEIIKFPIKKTKQSYVRIYDSFHSIDQYDYEDRPVGKLGELRVILYLEDLGPVALLSGRQDELQDEYKREAANIRLAGEQQGETGDIVRMPPQMGVEDDNGPQQRALLRELTDIESKVIWELENWKRAEEARFRYNLKQRESEFVEKLRADWRQKEIDRDKVKRSLTIQVFKEMENKMAAHTQKMQNKLNQLNKRESRIILLEEELKQKIAETSRQLAMKDNETDDQKAKMADEKKNLQKRIKELEDKNRKLEEITKNLEEDLRLYKIEQEKSPIELVKRELNERILEIGQLRKEIEKTEEIKEEYRKHFDRLKEEVIKLKRERDQVIIEANSKHDKELAVLKNQLTQIGQGGQLGGDKPNYNSLREELYRIKGGPAAADNFQGQAAMTHPTGGFNQYQSPASAAKFLPSIGGQQAPPQQHPGIQTSGAYTDSQEYANYTRLKNERALLLKQGYLESDPLVTQIDEALKRLRD